MSKRVFDFTVALLGLTVLSPVLLIVALLVWAQDFHSPFYVATRAGLGERPFQMIKLRSMVNRADRSGVDSTAGNDPRITPIGRFLRRTKLDEVPQLFNVLVGSMSLVGPRPNVLRETALYTKLEKGLLSVRPGITDLASIVFADEGDILKGADDPDLLYNQVIRPWKSALGLVYVGKCGSVVLDLRIILLTLRSAFNRQATLERAAKLAAELGASAEVTTVALRREVLRAAPPPGATSIVRDRLSPPT